MPAMRAFGFETLRDVLACAQSLPSASQDPTKGSGATTIRAI